MASAAEPLQNTHCCHDSAPHTDVSLEDGLEMLRAAIAAREKIDASLAVCFAADDSPRNAHLLFCQIGEEALTVKQWEAAELSAVRSLKKHPSYGRAFKLLGLALRGQGRMAEATTCHRYGLPPAIRELHFDSAALARTNSQSAGDAGVVRQQAYAAETFQLTPPFQLNKREIVELSATELQAVEAFTTVVPNGRLWFDTFNTVVWDKSDRVIDDICRGYPEVVQYRLGDVEPLKLAGTACLLGNRNAVNYYHWMNDVLPRLEVLQASGHQLESIDHFVVNRLDHEFQIQTLAEFGIEQDRLHTIDKGEYIVADELLMTTYGSNSLGMAQGPWNPAFLKRHIGPDAATGVKKRRLYLSRGSSGARGIGNEDALIEYVKQSGFELVQAESMTVREQAVLFSEAEVVLGPHGAGFTNIAFCQPGTTVIELFSAHILPCFWAISEVTDLRHVVHFCGDFDETSRPSEDEQYHRTADERRHSGFLVNVSEVGELLRALEIV